MPSKLLTARKVVLIGTLVAAILLPRLFNLGTVLTVDEPLWQSRAGTFIRALASGDLKRTLVGGQPGVTTVWIAGLARHFNSLATDQASIALASSLLILVSVYFLSRAWHWPWAVVAGFFLALDPFLIGHSRVVHTDGLFALFSFAGLSALLASLEPPDTRHQPIQRYLVFSGILTGLAVLTKIYGVIIFASGSIIIAWYTWSRTKQLTAIIKPLSLWLLTAGITIFLAWPVLWGNAPYAYRYLTGRTALHFEGTMTGAVSNHWWYYLREGFFRLTPAVTIFALLGLLGLRHENIFAPFRRSAFWFAASGLLFVVLLSAGSDKGDRYILFSLIAFAPLAALGLRVAADQLDARRPRRPFFWPVLLSMAVFSLMVADVIRLHPYYLAHYNRLYPIESQHKLGWGEGLESAARWLETHHKGASVAVYYPRVFSYFYRDGSVDSIAHADNKDYIIVYRAMFERGRDDPESDIINEFLNSGRHTAENIININGLPYVWIFPQTQSQ